LDEVITASFGVVDRNLASTALNLAKDESAGTAARIQALRLLYAQVIPTTTVSYERFTRSEVVGVRTRADGNLEQSIEPLEADFVTDQFVMFVTPLRTGDVERFATELSAVASGAQQPAMRNAAQRAAGAFRSYLRCPPGASAQSCVARFRAEKDPD
jgi:DNA-binding SARP family transcriptional activator